jgi:hypothetical protein
MVSTYCTAYMVLIIYKCANVYAFVNFIGWKNYLCRVGDNVMILF